MGIIFIWDVISSNMMQIMKRQIFYIDYPQEHQGDALHAYQCKFCKIDTVKINGLLENHLPDCIYRLEKEKTITE